MKKILSTLAITLALCGEAKAVVVQHIYLKDGSVLSGYIQKQSNGNLTFASDRATVCLNSTGVTITNERNYKLSDLNDAWKEWAEKNEEFEGIGDNRTLLLADVILANGKNAQKVKIQERGAVVKFLQMTPDVYSIAWKDVESIKGEKRAKNALSGINRVYQLRNNQEIEGQYAEENDSMLTLLLNNGVRQSFKTDDVVKYTFRAINPNQDIFAQSQLLDVVRKTNGVELPGIIIEQNYQSNSDELNYFLLRMQSGNVESIKVSEIQETRKEVNKAYDPKTDILLKVGDVVVNRQEAKTFNTEEKEENILLKTDGKVAIPDITQDAAKATKVTVEYRNANGNNVETYKLVKLKENTNKKGTTYSFSFRELVNAFIPLVSLETSVNHTTKAEYNVPGDGYYVLYDALAKTAIPFNLKK